MESKLLQIREPLLRWYQIEHRDLLWRKTKDPYHIWLSEIMLQQTRVEAVTGYYTRFLSKVPSIAALSTIPEDDLMKLWEGLGYYNRARNLQKAATIIMKHYDGVFPHKYEDVLELPGIGEYTASAICSICYEAATPAVDGNALRVIMRVLNSRNNIDEAATKKQVRQWLQPLYDKGDCNNLTQALIELGATVCIPNGIPRCNSCPLQNICSAYTNQTYNELPIRNSKKKRKQLDKTVFILRCNSKYAIRKRNSKGLLANLWEFYNIDCKLDLQEALDYLSDQGFEPITIEKQIPYTHIFSHIEWNMTAYYVECNHPNDSLIWIPYDQFQKQYALPTAFRVFIEREEF